MIPQNLDNNRIGGLLTTIDITAIVKKKIRCSTGTFQLDGHLMHWIQLHIFLYIFLCFFFLGGGGGGCCLQVRSMKASANAEVIEK